MPSLNELHKNYAEKGLVVIALHKPLPADKTEEFKTKVKSLGIAYPVAIDNEGKTSTQYGKNGLTFEGLNGDTVYWPPSFLIDGEGKLAKTVAGKFHTKTKDDKPECEKCEQTYTALKKDIEDLLAKSAPDKKQEPKK